MYTSVAPSRSVRPRHTSVARAQGSAATGRSVLSSGRKAQDRHGADIGSRLQWYNVYIKTQERTEVSTTMTIRLDDEVKQRLDRLSEATDRSKSFLAAEAVRAYVENNEWQVAEIRAALKEADADDFASDKDVTKLAGKWKVNAR